MDGEEQRPRRSGLSRRRFLKTAAGAGASVALTTAAGSLAGSIVLPQPVGAASGAPAGAAVEAPRIIPFEGEHQAGVDRPTVAQAATIMAAFDVVSPDRDDLRRTFRELTRGARVLANAETPPPTDPVFPPDESGILGSAIGPADLTVTFSVGRSLFDGRYGLAARTPTRLVAMPTFPNDQLDPTRTHGDLLMQVSGVDAAACMHAFRYLQMGTRSSIALRWMVEGFIRPNTQPGPGRTTTRNLLGFKDGTANLPPGSPATDELVWVREGDDEPAWTAGGSYLAVRTIRMFVEFWDRTALDEQEQIIGRTKRTGAPLGMDREEDLPDYGPYAQGGTIPLDAHIRLANPRTEATQASRIFRHGWNFSRGFDAAGQLDQGLLFLAYQRDLAAGFMAVQARLDGEPLEEYIRPEGGGFFFVLPGVTGADRYVGDTLLA